MIFADSGAGTWEGLDRTLGLLTAPGLVVFDDMTPATWHFERHEALNAEVRRALIAHPDLVVAELAFGNGVIVAAKRASGPSSEP